MTNDRFISEKLSTIHIYLTAIKTSIQRRILYRHYLSEKNSIAVHTTTQRLWVLQHFYPQLKICRDSIPQNRSYLDIQCPNWL